MLGIVQKKSIATNLREIRCQGFIQDFQFGGGDVVCGLTGMGEYFSQVTPRNGAKSIVVSFC